MPGLGRRPPDLGVSELAGSVVRFTDRQLREDPHTVADRIEAILRPRGPARYNAPSASRNSASSESSIE
jgi:hypothetical protein